MTLQVQVISLPLNSDTEKLFFFKENVPCGCLTLFNVNSIPFGVEFIFAFEY